MSDLHTRAVTLAVAMDLDHPDDIAVVKFAIAMKAKLKRSRDFNGRDGWQDMTADQLSIMLLDHVEKGDPLDVGNLAMMLHQNGYNITPAADSLSAALARPVVRALLGALGDIHDGEPESDDAATELEWCRNRAGEALAAAKGAAYRRNDLPPALTDALTLPEVQGLITALKRVLQDIPTVIRREGMSYIEQALEKVDPN